jgi:hypothetical protein
MGYIIIETHGGPEYAIIITDQDGNNLVFDTFSEPRMRQMTARQELLLSFKNGLKTH